MKTRELLEIYYKGLAKKQGWESALSDDFHFTGGDMTKPSPAVGKQAYIETIARFGKLFTDMRTREVFVQEDGAFVVANYDCVFPGGKKINVNVAELWKVKNEKLHALTIFFDTAGFEKFLNG